MPEWVDEIYGTRVEKHLVPGGTSGGLDKDPSFCIHTTEGSTLAGAIGTISVTGYAPHFTVGEDRIVQMRALSTTGSALRDHNDHFIQVECVGFSHEAVHDLTPESWRPLVTLSKYVHEKLGVPLYRPWGDQLPGFPASNNSRRQQGYALTKRGFYGHVDVPDQDPTWHWDPGSLDYTALFAAVKGQGGGDDMSDYADGWQAYIDAPNREAGEDWSKDKAQGFRHARFAAKNPPPAPGNTGEHTHKVVGDTGGPV